MYTAARIVHLVGAAIWFGGNVALVAALIPYARTLDPRERSELIGEIGRRFRPVGWTALILLSVSGLYFISRQGYLDAPDLLISTGHGRLVAAKLVLVAAVIGLSYLHDFVLGPRVAAAPGPDTGPRAMLIAFARVGFAFTAAAFVVGVLLAH